ncbi:hypothetical protein EMIHUDRAFT_229823 [Emiliania huxleyi CCMP1516]|uniref:TRP C-terminal domain-containing protein n=2 Tax=Emiliania huxleyi TaxID=2903 RepID=A0A0D3KCG3_EMIH1|nr:hypothetical protein EMIHUDRAFT_229823 [Emiliania huxleyi CCMP1516]EOD33448.1 hypothetical protein EMIHUDRAFT_229823 [Emiliania huxleyi CCMP1516]|eukprot:XP_005785877.1 hypothetical protein EMIHUDRAFT_229823 [Emiliania huxleyi CCMP1516]
MARYCRKSCGLGLDAAFGYSPGQVYDGTFIRTAATTAPDHYVYRAPNGMQLYQAQEGASVLWVIGANVGQTNGLAVNSEVGADQRCPDTLPSAWAVLGKVDPGLDGALGYSQVYDGAMYDGIFTRTIIANIPHHYVLLASSARKAAHPAGDFLWRDYRAPLMYWELLDLIRKIFLAALILFVQTDLGETKVLRLVIAALVSAVYLVALALARPFERSDDLYLSCLSNLLLTCCFVVGILVNICDGDVADCDRVSGLSTTRATMMVLVASCTMLVVSPLVVLSKTVDAWQADQIADNVRSNLQRAQEAKKGRPAVRSPREEAPPASEAVERGLSLQAAPGPKSRWAWNAMGTEERKKTDNPREGWEDGTPPPHRDFKERGVGYATVA